MLLTREQILSAQDLVTEAVAVPEWGGEVRVKSLSGAERDAYEASVMRITGTNAQLNLLNARAKLVALAVIDENGKRMFGDGDVIALAAKSAAALQRVFDVANRLSGLNARDLEELTKNSGNGQHEGLSLG